VNLSYAIESAIRLHYDSAPLDDYERVLLVDMLIDELSDDHPDIELARYGIWSGTTTEWGKNGPGIVRRVPLVYVTLTDKKPSYTENTRTYMEVLRGKYCWFMSGGKWDDATTALDIFYHLPPEWHPEGQRYWVAAGDTEELALAEASKWAISWARRTEVTP